jgi:hypothetical protein
MTKNKEDLFKIIRKAIDSGDFIDLNPHLPSLFFQLCNEYKAIHGHQPDKQIKIHFLLETFWGGCCG